MEAICLFKQDRFNDFLFALHTQQHNVSSVFTIEILKGFQAERFAFSCVTAPNAVCSTFKMCFVSFSSAEHEEIPLDRPGHRIKNNDSIITAGWRKERLIAARSTGPLIERQHAASIFVFTYDCVASSDISRFD
jgi:hypothetical protein